MNKKILKNYILRKLICQKKYKYEKLYIKFLFTLIYTFFLFLWFNLNLSRDSSESI